MGTDGKPEGRPVEAPDGAVRRRGRPPGARNKAKGPPPDRVRLRDVVARAYTPEQLEKILKRLTSDQAARLLASIEPRAREDAPASTFRLQIVGLPGGTTCPACGWSSDQPVPVEESPPVEGPGESVREAARWAHRPFPSEPPAVRDDDEDGDGEDSTLDPPRQRLLDPAGKPINLGDIPVKPSFPYSPGEIP